MRTIEILLVIVILLGASIIASFFAVLPSPRQVSSLNLRRLALTTLQTLDFQYDLSNTVFKNESDPAWGQLQVALSICLPANVVYNLTAYEMQSGSGDLYKLENSISNAESSGIASNAASYLVASTNMTFRISPENISRTLYILNCSDTNSWWITGYTSQGLAQDLYGLLLPYFNTTIMVQNTTQLGQLLNGTKISNSPYENITNAVVINTCGEAVPIPSGYYMTKGYNATYDSYSPYCHILGNRTRYFNWTWASIVGYPLYYVSNTLAPPISTSNNTWGIFGMKRVGPSGLNAFFQGLNNASYSYDPSGITGPELASVPLSSDALYYCNYYGVYPSPYQTATRALNLTVTGSYGLTPVTLVFDPVDIWIAGAVFKHAVSGSFFSLGLARTPDIRLTAIGLLSFYKPNVYSSVYTVTGTSRFVVLQLGQVGGG